MRPGAQLLEFSDQQWVYAEASRVARNRTATDHPEWSDGELLLPWGDCSRAPAALFAVKYIVLKRVSRTR
jgi:hypothetical protein